jgi:hypothetical protein
MKIRVTLDEQPLAFIRGQAPETRRALRDALRNVESGKLFPVHLDDDLEGFCKLRVGVFRLILKSTTGTSGPGFRVVFAERRRLVYLLFSQIIGLE